MTTKSQEFNGYGTNTPLEKELFWGKSFCARILVNLYCRDDMGLGKSVQVSCLLLAMYHKNGSVDDKHVNRVTVRDGLHSSNNNCQYPALIVAPASVLENWRRELTTWGYFVVEVLGSKYTAEESIEAALQGWIRIAKIV